MNWQVELRSYVRNCRRSLGSYAEAILMPSIEGILKRVTTSNELEYFVVDKDQLAKGTQVALMRIHAFLPAFTGCDLSVLENKVVRVFFVAGEQ
jgi:hypothetical protein